MAGNPSSDRQKTHKMSHVKKKYVAWRKNAQPSPVVHEVSSGETSSSSGESVAQLEPVLEGPTVEHGCALEGNLVKKDEEVSDGFCKKKLRGNELTWFEIGCDDAL